MRGRLSSQLITLHTLITARWVLIAITVPLGLVFSGAIPGLDSPGLHLLHGTTAIVGWFAVIAVWSALNIVAMRFVEPMSRSNRWAGLQLAGDALALSGLFAVSGGAANPFTVLYFVPIMLATQVSPRWTWGVASVCMVSFGLLFVVGAPDDSSHGMHFAGHLKGMWFAFAVSGAVMTIFVHRIAVAIASARQELFALRESALRDRQLAQVGSLAAGAAHELGTPLATMTVLLGEISRMKDPAEVEETIESVKRELFRCKHIIQSMANSELCADRLSSQGVVPWPARDIVKELPSTLEVRDETEGAVRVRAPQAAVAEILRELVSNAEEADPDGSIRLIVGFDGDLATFAVDDDGPGMSEDVLAKATDPFFTTRSSGSHMGLGLFVAESQAHQLGGKLEVETREGAGSRVCLKVPAAKGGSR